MFKISKTTVIIIIIALVVIIGGIWLWQRGPETEVRPLPEGSREEISPETKADNQAVESLKLFLAENLGVSEGEIGVLNATRQDWPNGCLGMVRGGEFCTQVITPGYEITVRVKNQELKYRTNLDGSVIRRDTGGKNIEFLKG